MLGKDLVYAISCHTNKSLKWFRVWVKGIRWTPFIICNEVFRVRNHKRVGMTCLVRLFVASQAIRWPEPWYRGGETEKSGTSVIRQMLCEYSYNPKAMYFALYIAFQSAVHSSRLHVPYHTKSSTTCRCTIRSNTTHSFLLSLVPWHVYHHTPSVHYDLWLQFLPKERHCSTRLPIISPLV